MVVQKETIIIIEIEWSFRIKGVYVQGVGSWRSGSSSSDAGEAVG